MNAVILPAAVAICWVLLWIPVLVGLGLRIEVA